MERARDPWTQEALIQAISPASKHVKSLLGALVRTEESNLEELGVSPVAIALVGRICQGRGREPLLRRRDRGLTRTYSLVEGVEGLVATALSYEAPACTREHGPRRSRPARRPPPANTRRESTEETLADDTVGELRIARSIPHAFLLELLQFLKRTSRDRFLLVSDGHQSILRSVGRDEAK